MIQRIQSIFLLLVCIAMDFTAFSPLLIISLPSDVLDISISNLLNFNSFGILDGQEVLKHTWGVVTIAILSALLAFVNIFLYKKRKLQIKIGNLTTFLIVLYYITLGVYLYSFSVNDNISIINIQYGIVLPFIALIFNILAVYRIKKDEKLVRSMNRIR